MGSFSTINGDLALDMLAMFESSKQQFSIGAFISVPNHLRNLDEQAFTPMLISIGPIHLSNPKLQIMKKCKVQFCECFIQRANIDLQDLIQTIRSLEGKIRSYYLESIVSSISSDDFVTMILVDGMFILEYFCYSYLKEDDPTIGIPEWMHPSLQFDLVLLENQLPFFVLKVLFQQANFPAKSELERLSFVELAFKFFGRYNFQMKSFKNSELEIEHFTDLVRFFYLSESEKLPHRRFGGVKLSYSATQLYEAGVTFKVAEEYGRHLFGLRFDLENGVLEIPCIRLNDEMIRLIRNIIALEQSHYVWNAYVTDFFVILDFLIDNANDVDLLCDKGFLINYLGDSNDAALAVKSLFNTNISWVYMNPKYSKICEDLNAFYKKPWNRWRATCWHQFFSTPWRSTSTWSAIILLLLTLTQTVCSLRSTKW